MRHDFSKEFPEFFTSDHFELKNIASKVSTPLQASIDVDFWKNKYIQLLEVYNEALSSRVFDKRLIKYWQLQLKIVKAI